MPTLARTFDSQQWLRELFEFEWCPECGRDERHHTACSLLGHPFARCDLAPVLKDGEVVMNPENYVA